MLSLHIVALQLLHSTARQVGWKQFFCSFGWGRNGSCLGMTEGMSEDGSETGRRWVDMKMISVETGVNWSNYCSTLCQCGMCRHRVCLSDHHIPEWLSVESRKQCHTIAQGL